ncbi:hypothetical protein ABMA28_001658 [Loxostege sticticalis]|uniref:Uncharacterized protein n=1 Tax=Loxostege sticticalis TaxID=481309 RepID=A0ABD0T2I4_LOXSC
MKVPVLIFALFLFAFTECRNVKRDVDRPKIQCNFLDGVGAHPFLFVKWGGVPYVLTWDKDAVAVLKKLNQPCPYAPKHGAGKQPLKNAPDFASSYTEQDILNFFAEDCTKPF